MATETWYVVNVWESHGPPMREVRVSKSTSKSVWVADGSTWTRRARSVSCGDHYFPDFAEAKAFLVRQVESQAESRRRIADEAEAKLRWAKGLHGSAALAQATGEGRE